MSFRFVVWRAGAALTPTGNAGRALNIIPPTQWLIKAYQTRPAQHFSADGPKHFPGECQSVAQASAPASSGGVPPPAPETSPGGTPGSLAGADACATLSMALNALRPELRRVKTAVAGQFENCPHTASPVEP